MICVIIALVLMGRFYGMKPKAGEKSALVKQLRYKAVEQETLSSP